MHRPPHIGFKPTFSLQSASGPTVSSYMINVDASDIRTKDFSALYVLSSMIHKSGLENHTYCMTFYPRESSNDTLSPKCDHTKGKHSLFYV